MGKKGGQCKTYFISLKLRPNDRNMSTQHIVTLLGATYCVRLATLLRHVGCFWLSLKIAKFEPTTTDMSQQGGQTRTTCCAQQCYDMLRWLVAIVWRGLKISSCFPNFDAGNA